nr:carbon-nitrogen hydrolase family protein [Nocardioidaceae bacterium]
MGVLTIAAVQATYVLMNRDATIDRVEELTEGAARQRAQLVVFPEAFVPGTPIWIDTRPIWDGDDEWFAMLMDNSVTIPGPAADRLATIAEKHSVWLVVGVQEREPNGSTIYNTVLYFSPDGRLVDRHRK